MSGLPLDRSGWAAWHTCLFRGQSCSCSKGHCPGQGQGQVKLTSASPAAVQGAAAYMSWLVQCAEEWRQALPSDAVPAAAAGFTLFQCSQLPPHCLSWCSSLLTAAAVAVHSALGCKCCDGRVSYHDHTALLQQPLFVRCCCAERCICPLLQRRRQLRPTSLRSSPLRRWH